MIEVRPQTLVVFSDIGCPWAHHLVHQLHEARHRLGLHDRLAFDHRSFPLELFNERPTPKLTLDAEIPVVGALDPAAGWSLWRDEPARYPVSTLLAMEAVHAAKAQGLGLSDRLDRALRVALFRDSRCITLHHEVVSVATEVEGLELKALEEALIDGSHRRRIFEDMEEAQRSEVQGSPHVYLSDGTDHHNPGITKRWEGKSGGFPVIEDYDPSIYEDIVKRAVALEEVEDGRNEGA